MDKYDKIYTQFKFEPPSVYLEMKDAGFFDFKNANYLYLTDLEWIPLDEKFIYGYEHILEGLVPFAKSARVDVFCWSLKLVANGKIPIVFCPIGEMEVFVYAEDFTAFLYRVLLEEFSGSWLVDSFGIAKTSEHFCKYAEQIKKYLPNEWGDTLVQLAQSPLKEVESGVYGVCSRKECDLIIQTSLAFPQRDKPIKHPNLR